MYTIIFFSGVLALASTPLASAGSLADPAFLRELANLAAYGRAFAASCTTPEDRGTVRAGKFTPDEPAPGFPLETLDCRGEARSTMGLGYGLSVLIDYEKSAAGSWKEYSSHHMDRETYELPYAQQLERLHELEVRAGVSASGDATDSEAAESCRADAIAKLTLAVPQFQPPATPVIPAELKTVALARKLEAALGPSAGPGQDCASRLARVSQIFREVGTVTDARDAVWIGWAARAPEALLRHPTWRRLLGAIAQTARLAPLEDHDAFVTNSFASLDRDSTRMQNNVLILRAALLGFEARTLKRAGFAHPADLARATPEARAAWLELATTGEGARTLGGIFSEAAARDELAHEFSRSCDEKLGAVFGRRAIPGANATEGPGIIAAGTGMELPFPGETLHDGPFPRWHVFSNLHLYDGGRREGDHSAEPLYIPPGYQGWGGGQDENSCFATFYYHGFGNYPNARLVICHLDEGRLRPERNEFGSSQAGYLGGNGGSGGSVYSHSHLILYSADRKIRLNFSDAFCR